MADRKKMALILFVAIQAVAVVCRHSTDGESISEEMETMGPWSADMKSFIKALSFGLIDSSGDPRAGAYLSQRIGLAIQRGNAASVIGTMLYSEVQGKAEQDGRRHITPQRHHEGISLDVGSQRRRVQRPNERAPAEQRIRAQAEVSRVRAHAEDAKNRAQAEMSRAREQANYAKVRAQSEKQTRVHGDGRRHMTPLWQYDGIANQLSRRRAQPPQHPESSKRSGSHRRHKSHEAPESSDEAWSPRHTAPTAPTAHTTTATTSPTTTTTTTPEPVFPPLDPRYRRIYNADETAKIEDYPFIAAILVNNELWCGGAIINGDSVLTAAHCLQLQYNNRFFREYVKMLSVRVGTSNATDGGEHYRVTELFFHPNYKPQSLEFNFALLKLNKNITFQDSKVQPITVARTKVIPIDKTITFLGWGSVLGVGEGGGLVLLQKLDLPVYDLSDCQEIYGRDLVTRSNFCAGFITTRKNVCNHDAGGPAIMDGVLTGVLSFSSKRCDDTDKPAVFSNVGHAADWLDEIWESGRSRAQKDSVPGWMNIRIKDI